jgi:Bacteriophage CI repressor helix-turn-helix domain
MKTRDIIERLQRSLGFTSLAALARELEIDPSAINAAIRQKRLPDVWLYKVAYRTGRRVEWLRSGEGPEFASIAAEESAHYLLDLPPALQALLKQRAALTEAEQSIVDNALKLLLSSDPDMRLLVVQVAEKILESRKLPRQQRHAAPPKKAAGSV